MTLAGAALATFGVDAGAYTGTGLPTFHIADDYHKIKTEVPFAAGFDQRDETVAGVARQKADAWLEQIVALLGKGKGKVWEVSVHALVGASDRYLATLDDHLAFELGDRILLVSFSMLR